MEENCEVCGGENVVLDGVCRNCGVATNLPKESGDVSGTLSVESPTEEVITPTE